MSSPTAFSVTAPGPDSISNRRAETKASRRASSGARRRRLAGALTAGSTNIGIDEIHTPAGQFENPSQTGRGRRCNESGEPIY
jgi:hypothetical protein